MSDDDNARNMLEVIGHISAGITEACRNLEAVYGGLAVKAAAEAASIRAARENWETVALQLTAAIQKIDSLSKALPEFLNVKAYVLENRVQLQRRGYGDLVLALDDPATSFVEWTAAMIQAAELLMRGK